MSVQINGFEPFLTKMGYKTDQYIIFKNSFLFHFANCSGKFDDYISESMNDFHITHEIGMSSINVWCGKALFLLWHTPDP